MIRTQDSSDAYPRVLFQFSRGLHFMDVVQVSDEMASNDERIRVVYSLDPSAAVQAVLG